MKSEDNGRKFVVTKFALCFRELFSTVVLTSSLFLMLALFSYHYSDSSWSHYVTGIDIENITGVFGAFCSDFLFYFFGYCAYMLPASIIFYVIKKSKKRYECKKLNKSGSILLGAFTFAGFVFIVVSLCGILQVCTFNFLKMPFSNGGIIGFSVLQKFVPKIGLIGTIILLTTVFACGINLLSGLSTYSFFSAFLKGFYRSLFTVARYLYNFCKFVISFCCRLKKKKTTDIKFDRLLKSKCKKESSKYDSKKVSVDQSNVIETASKTNLVDLTDVRKCYELPSVSLLDTSGLKKKFNYSVQQLRRRASEVENRLSDFRINGKVTDFYPGPVVTRFEVKLAAGTKVGSISSLVKDLSRSLSVVGVRVVEVIPGKSVIGLELPNSKRETVGIYDILSSDVYKNSNYSLPLALGKDIAGHTVVVDLAKMPHLLVAGTTGSGKSVGINAMLLSILYKATPKDVRLILIDPKMLEMSVYSDIPHLLVPVVTDMNEAVTSLRWCVLEMERRYKLMASLGVRNIVGYNNKIKEIKRKRVSEGKEQKILASDFGIDSKLCSVSKFMQDSDAELSELPKIVVVADEFADMMVVVGKKVETLIARLAQKARASGIHLLLATQRPSVDVITGLIKANIPTRISFQVSSKIDSRTILDQSGAEQLLGNGDMLYLPPGSATPIRVHGAYVSDNEVFRVVKHLKGLGRPDYITSITDDGFVESINKEMNGDSFIDSGSEKDSFYDEAVSTVFKANRVSVSMLQRKFKIGYNRAARLVDDMEKTGIVSKMKSNGSRDLLVKNVLDEG